MDILYDAYPMPIVMLVEAVGQVTNEQCAMTRMTTIVTLLLKLVHSIPLVYMHDMMH